MLTAQQMMRLYPYDKKQVELEDYELADVVGFAAEMYRESLLKQIIGMESDNDIRLRPSLLGKAAIDIVARKLYPQWYTGGLDNPRFWQLFHDGDTFEADYIVWLTSRGVRIESTQVPCNWNGITGHADLVVQLGSSRVLLELKTANTGYFTSIQKMQSDDRRAFRYGEEYREVPYLASQFSDFRGHLTQGSIYAAGIGVDEVVVVLKHKDTSEIILYNLTQTERLKCIERAERIVRAWDSVEELSDLFVWTGIPEPRPEVAKGKPTGRYLLNAKMYGSPIIPLIYEWEQDNKGKLIINGYRVPSSAVPRMNQNVLQKYHKSVGVFTYDENVVEELIDEWKQAS